MASENVVTNIVASADFSDLISNVNKVNLQLSQLKQTLTNTDKALALNATKIQQGFASTLRSTGQFSTHFVNLTADVDKFGKNLDQGRLKLKEYYGVWQQHSRTSGGLIRDLARQQVALQNAIVQPLGRNAEGLMQFNVNIPRGLDETKNKTALLKQEMQIFNKVIQDGGVQLINWGKNTQWAGRQLTVGLTVPIAAFGKAAADAFREADEQLVRLTKVYGGIAGSSAAELATVRKEVAATAKELAGQYGASYKETIALSADIAATGKQGAELLNSVRETTRLSVLGEVDRQEAMKATLAIQTAFNQNTQELAESINFLNAVENQTSTTLNDLVEAIPKAGPVVKSLGGDIEDLALYLTAMKEGGINASEGANAIKSSLASLINPTKVAKEMFMGLGIDLGQIVTSNAGNLTATILDLQKALDTLDPLSKTKAIEQLFGKFQFARLSALFDNLGRQGSQTLQVLDLMNASVGDLASVAGRELAQITESASGRFRRALEQLKADLAGVGEQFLNVGTYLINIVDKIVNFANKLPGPVKTLMGLFAGFTALAGPLIMLTGVLANFLGYVVKGAAHLRAFFKGGEGWRLLTPEILAAQRAGNLAEQTFYNDAKAAMALGEALSYVNDQLTQLQTKAGSATISSQPTISTIAGQTIIAGAREVVPSHPLVSDRDTRSFSHPNPVSQMTPEQKAAQTIFGIVPGAPLVNQKISNNPQMYMSGDLPKVEGVSSIRGVSTGIVAEEAAKWHAMTGALAMQSKEEIALLKREVAATGLITTSLSDSYQALLPEMSRLTSLAAVESAQIVADLQSSKISVDQARSKIILLNQQIEAMMGQAATGVATAQGRTINLTQLPIVDQPAFDPVTGKSNMKELTRPRNRNLITRIAQALRVKTFGAPYSTETTRPRRFNMGGNIENFGPNKTVVSGPSSVNYDDRFGNIPLGGYVLNQGASLDPRNKDLVNAAPSTFSNSGSTMKAMLTPKETIFGPGIHRDPELYAAVDAANNGYAFGGDIFRNKKNYGLNPASMVVGNTLKQLLSRKPTLSAGSISGNPQSMFSLFGISRRGKFSESGSFIGPRGGEIVSVSAKPATATYGAALARMPINPDTGKPHTLQSLNGAMARRGLKGEEIDAYLATLGYMSQGGPLIGTTTSLLNNVIKDPKTRNQILQEIDEQFYKKVAEIKRSGLSLTDSNNPYHSVSNEVLNKYFAPGSLERNYWDQFKVQTSGLNPLYMSDLKRGAGHSSSAGARVIYLTAPDGTKIKIGKVKGSGKDTMAFHSANADWESEYGFNLGGMIPGGNIQRGRYGYGVPSLASSAIARLTARWKPQMQFRQPGYQYTLGNQDPLHGPLQIGRTMVPKNMQNDPEWTREVIYRDDRFARQAVLPQFLTGNLQDRGMYATAQYMSGNKYIMGQMQEFGNHPLGPIAAMRTLQRKFTGKLYRGLRLDRTFKGLPQDLIEAIGIARSTGDASGLIGREFIMRRSSWSKSPTIASFFAPGHGVDPNNLVIEAAIKNRNILPAGDMFPDKKFLAPYGQDWSAGSRFGGGQYKSEQEAIFGGKFRVVGFKDGKLQVETVVDGARAKGGPVNANRPYLVGENGPEIFVPKNSGGIIPGGDIVKNRIGYGLPNIPTMPGYNIPLATQMGMTPVTQNQSSGLAGAGRSGYMKSMLLGQAAGFGLSQVGGKMFGGMGQMGGYMLGQMATDMFLMSRAAGTARTQTTLLTKAFEFFSKMPGPVKLIAVLLGVGTAIKTINDKINERRRIINSAFGPEEETVKKLNLKYKTLTSSMEENRKELELRNAAAAAFKYTTTKVPGQGIDITVKELDELKKQVKEQLPTELKMLNTASEEEAAQKATQLKAILVSSGKSVEEANEILLALIRVSNKADQELSILGDKGFGSIIDKASAAKSTLETFNKVIKDGNTDQLGKSLDTALNAYNNLADSIENTKDKNGKLITSSEAYQEILKKIKETSGGNVAIGLEGVNAIVKQNAEMSKLVNTTDTLASIMAKVKLSTSGIAFDFINMGPAAAEALSIIIEKQREALKSGPYSQIVKDMAKVSKTNSDQIIKNAEVSAKALEKEIELHNKKIKKIKEEADARKKALDEENADEDINLQIKAKQLEYQDKLAAGDMSGAAQAQIAIQQLVGSQQITLAKRAIDLKAEQDIAAEQSSIDALNARIDGLQNKIDGAKKTADAAAAKTENLGRLLNELIALTTSATDGPLDAKEQDRLKLLISDLEKAGYKDIAQSISSGGGRYLGGTFVPYPSGIEGIAKEAFGKAIYNNKGELKTSDTEVLALLNRILSGTPLPTTGTGLSFDRESGGYRDRSTGVKYTPEQARVIPVPVGGRAGTNRAFVHPEHGGGKSIEMLGPIKDLNKNGYLYKKNGDVLKNGQLVGRWYNQGHNNPGSNFTFAQGGSVKNYAPGGNVSGPGTATSDSIPAMLSDGEYVIKASSVAKYGTETFDALNAGRFANGGKVSKMGTADSMIKTAESMLGYQEGKNNDTIFGRFAQKAYDLQSRYIAWCGAFINWAAKKSGVDLASMVWTPGGAQSFRKSGKWTTMSPVRGDLAFMDFPGDGVNRISHVGLVKNVLSKNAVSTIEGNTSGSGSQRSGGAVLAKIRQYNMKNAPIVGFGRPSYKPVDTVEYKYGTPEYYGADDAKSDYENDRYTVGRGDTLSGIAAKYGVSVKQLMEMNPQLNDPKYMGGSRIFAGTKVNIKKFAQGGLVTRSLDDSGNWIKGPLAASEASMEAIRKGLPLMLAGGGRVVNPLSDYGPSRFANGGMARMFHAGGPVGHTHSSAPHAMGMSSMGSSSPSLKPKKATSLFDKKIWEKTANFFALPQMAKTGLDIAKYGGINNMIAARLMGAPMKSSIGDNATTALNVIPIPVAKLLTPAKNLLAKATNKLALRFASGNVSSSLASRALGSQLHGGPGGITDFIKQDLNLWNFPATYLTGNEFSAASYAANSRTPISSLYSFKAKAGERVNILNMAKRATDEQKEAALKALATPGKDLHGTPEMQNFIKKAIADAKSLDEVLYLIRAYPAPKGIKDLGDKAKWKISRNNRVFESLGITSSETDLVTNLLSTKVRSNYKIADKLNELEAMTKASNESLFGLSTLKSDDYDQSAITNMSKFVSSQSDIDFDNFPGANKLVQKMINHFGVSEAGAYYAGTDLGNWIKYLKVRRHKESFGGQSSLDLLTDTMFKGVGPESSKLLQLLKRKMENPDRYNLQRGNTSDGSFVDSNVKTKISSAISSMLSKTKSLAYKPINLINQYMNYFKAKKMLKNGVYHGSADLGRNSDGPFSGITELSGDYARDPYHGMGFFGTTSKSEADMYAGGYNAPGQWGESYGSINEITKLPFGRYLDFTKDLKNQNYAMWKMFGDQGFMGAHNNLGSIMNDAGMTGAIMPRISSGMAPDDINLAKWIALNKPKGTILKELGLGFARGGYVNPSSYSNMSVPSYAMGGAVGPRYNIPTNTVSLGKNQIPGYNKGGAVHHYDVGGFVVNAQPGQDEKMIASMVVDMLDQKNVMRAAMSGVGRRN